MNVPDVSHDCLSQAQLRRLADSDVDIGSDSAAHLSTCVDCQTRLDDLTSTDRMKPYHDVARSKKFQEAYFGINANGQHGLGDLRIARYEIESVIGAGGMGIVYRAQDLELNRQVAIKVLTNLDSATGLARFERESLALSQLNHTNVVPVHTSGKTEDGRPYLVMPLVEGPSLKELLEREPLEPREAARLTIQIAHGLAAAHQRGLVHRDVKPANILLDTRDDQAKVLDFGLVRGPEDNTLTRTHMICGTPEYMSPEQANSLEMADARSDVYSLGVTLYECLTGSVPFRGRPLDVLKQHRENEPVPLHRLNQTIPSDLQTICLKAIEKEPRERYGTARLFAEDLQRFVDGRAIAARPIGPFGKAWRWSRRNRALAAVSSLGLCALVAGTIVSTVLWINSARNASLAEQRNRSLLASQKTLKANQTNLRQSIQQLHGNSFQDREQFLQMPTSIRNTLLISMRQSWELLLRTADNEPEPLRQLVDEILEASAFALRQDMPNRAAELTELNRRVLKRLLKLESANSPLDSLRAARIYNQFADARNSLPNAEQYQTIIKDSLRDAQRFSQLAAKHALTSEISDVREEAAVESFRADRGLIECRTDLTQEEKAKQLIALAEAVASHAKSDAVMGRWLELQQRISGYIARVSPTEQAIEYRTKRSEEIERLIRWHRDRGKKVDSMVERRLVVNRVLLGVLYERLGKQQQARNCWIESLGAFEGLLLFYPLNAQVRADHSETLMLVANLDWGTNDRDSALEWYRQALSQHQMLVQTNPNDHELTRRGVLVHELVAQRYVESGDAKTAGETFVMAADLARQLEGNVNVPDPAARQFDRALSLRLLQQAAAAFEAAGMPEHAISTREQLKQLTPK